MEKKECLIHKVLSEEIDVETFVTLSKKKEKEQFYIILIKELKNKKIVSLCKTIQDRIEKHLEEINKLYQERRNREAIYVLTSTILAYQKIKTILQQYKQAQNAFKIIAFSLEFYEGWLKRVEEDTCFEIAYY